MSNEQHTVEAKSLDQLEVNELVRRVSQKIHDEIRSNTSELHESQRWLVHARVVNFVFAHFYKPVMADAERVVYQRAASP